MLKIAICETVRGTAFRFTLMAVVFSSAQLTLLIPVSPEQEGDAEMAMEAGSVSVK